MNIERDKFYTTRDGRRAKCLTTEYPGNLPFLMLLDSGNTFTVSVSGEHRYWSSYEFDIIGPWVEPVKPLECWMNVYSDESREYFRSEAGAKEYVETEATRIAVHMREVTP